MYKLLNAGFTRLKKSNLFFVLVIFTIVLACFVIYTQYSDMKNYNENIQIDQLLLNYITIIGIIIAIFTSLFLGREYSDGTLRNKIVVGSNRIKIYFSNLLIVMITSLLSQVLYMLVIALIGIHIFGTLNMPLATFGIIFIDIIGIILSFSSIFVFIAMIVPNKTIISITSILLAFGMMMISITLLSRIEATEYRDVAKIENSETNQIEMVQEKNPRYLTEDKRKIYQTILNFIPSGQAFMVAGRMDINFHILPVYSLGVIIFFSGTGLYLFNRKELN